MLITLKLADILTSCNDATDLSLKQANSGSAQSTAAICLGDTFDPQVSNDSHQAAPSSSDCSCTDVLESPMTSTSHLHSK